jgi:hypothetical protein
VVGAFDAMITPPPIPPVAVGDVSRPTLSIRRLLAPTITG